MDILLQIGVKAFLKNKEGKYLLLQRSDAYAKAPGEWDIPGGRINPRTSLLGISIKCQVPFPLSSWPVEKPHDYESLLNAKDKDDDEQLTNIRESLHRAEYSVRYLCLF